MIASTAEMMKGAAGPRKKYIAPGHAAYTSVNHRFTAPAEGEIFEPKLHHREGTAVGRYCPGYRLPHNHVFAHGDRAYA